jgi:hypothetical protein
MRRVDVEQGLSAAREGKFWRLLLRFMYRVYMGNSEFWSDRERT